MAASTSLMAYKIVFTALGCLMLATLIYTLVTDGSPFRRELFTPWMAATLADFYVNVVAISVWVIYKESSWIHSVFWIISLVCFGSIATCAYIVKKLFEISCQGTAQDPLDLLFLRNDVRKAKCSFVIFWRIFFSVLGLFLASVVTYTLVTDGSPFRRELLTPWMVATLIDFYINIFTISVWVTHKESSWLGAFFWICLLICFGGKKVASEGKEVAKYLVLHQDNNKWNNQIQKDFSPQMDQSFCETEAYDLTMTIFLFI